MYKYIVIIFDIYDRYIILDNEENLKEYLKVLFRQYPSSSVRIFKSEEKELLDYYE